MIRLKNILSEKILKEAPGDPPWKPEEEPEVVENPSSVYSGLSNVMLDAYVITYDRKTGETTSEFDPGEYVGGKSRRSKRLNWWKVKGIDTRGMSRMIRKFATQYIRWMASTIDQAIGPVVTSGYRGPDRQVRAMYDQWVGDNNYIKKTYKRGNGPLIGGEVDRLFDTHRENPEEGIKKAIDYVQDMQDKGKRISNHQVAGAIDIALFVDPSHNDNLYRFLEKAKANGIIEDFLDERDMTAPHFHINLKGKPLPYGDESEIS